MLTEQHGNVAAVRYRTARPACGRGAVGVAVAAFAVFAIPFPSAGGAP